MAIRAVYITGVAQPHREKIMTTTQFRNFDMYSHRITQIILASGAGPMKVLAAAIIANNPDGFEYVTEVMIADAEAAGEYGEDRELYSEAARYITERFMTFRVLLYKKIQNAGF